MENANKENNRGPLAGIKVVDLTRFQAGPTCTQILGDMGAEVIKVEEPGGDAGRLNSVVDGFSTYFAAFNRNKKSVTLNLRTEKGKELMRRLVSWGDVVAENYRPGVMARLGFSYEDMCQLTPGIIMVSVSGFGQTGPYAQRAAFNSVGEAMSGRSSVTRSAGQPPSGGGAIADTAGGVFGAMGAILALYHRKNTGEGQHVDSSLLDGTLFFMASRFLRHGAAGEVTEGSAGGDGASGYFLTSDGRYFNILGGHEGHFDIMCGLMGRPEVAKDPRYGSRWARREHAAELNDMVAQWARTMTADALEAALEEVGQIPYSRVNEVADVLEDPHIRAREMVMDVEHHGKGLFPLVGVTPKLSKSPGSIRMACPLLGEHNEEVYCGMLGVSKEELGKLEADGVI